MKSYFNKTLYKHDMKMGWPLYLCYFLFYFLTQVVPFLAETQVDYGQMSRYGIPELHYSIFRSFSMIPTVSLLYGIIIALVLFQYLYTARTANGLHALPLRREGHFLTHISAGLSYFILPNVLISLLLVVVELKYNAFDLLVVLQWFAAATLITLFFFALAVFCAMFTGALPMLALFYVIWNFLFFGIYQLVNILLHIVLYGYGGLSVMADLAYALSPYINLSMFGFVGLDSIPGTAFNSYEFRGWGWVLIYAAVAVLLLAASLLLYRKRQMERAGDVVAVPWAKHLFRYGMALCGGVGGALMIYNIFIDAGQKDNVLLLSVLIIFCAAVFYLAAEMLLEKSFRVLRSAWKGIVRFSAVVVIAMVGISLAANAYVTRVPELSEIRSVTMRSYSIPPYDSASYTEQELTDPEEITLLLSVHQAAIAERKDNEDAWQSSLDISYALQDGSIVERSYQILMSEEKQQDPDSAANLLLTLRNQESILLNSYFPQELTVNDIVSAEYYQYVGEFYEGGYTSTLSNEMKLTTLEAQELYLAVMEDMQAGRLGQRSFQNEVDGCDLTLYFYGSYPNWFNGSGSKTARTEGTSITIYEDATATWAVLNRLMAEQAE